MTHSPKTSPPHQEAIRDIEALAEQQGVKPIEDVSSLFGTWPGKPDDGFEEAIDRLREKDRTARQSD
ncbi:MAG: hypothetical protein KC931_17210 [Candidatus Omnitrophica bacterium]|nr:hypothetical protein [Candidatus Omnitrophota bacterium]MCA9423503.1 hypothetical protein [Candidatus Omnitrophota bacterium]MCA9429755.1 hypothetical protein [Candidatus Omnitrophota bacterium]MCA9435716.1 hypothetical protein [Candidatus Omnitrophota bacterium]MCA9442081.1 hypothetical protein [Candidatus Omnitrophota bacterium]